MGFTEPYSITKARLREIMKNKAEMNPFFATVYSDLTRLDFYHDSIILNYLLPVIERLIIEILELDGQSNIEVYEQGRFRTANAILKDESTRKVLRNYLDEYHLKLLLNIFSEEGLRNAVLKEFLKTTDPAVVEKVRYVAYLLLFRYTTSANNGVCFEKMPVIDWEKNL